MAILLILHPEFSVVKCKPQGHDTVFCFSLELHQGGAHIGHQEEFLHGRAGAELWQTVGARTEGLKARLGLRFWCCLNLLVSFAGDSGGESGLNEVYWPYIQKCRIMKLGKGLQDDWFQPLTHVHEDVQVPEKPPVDGKREWIPPFALPSGAAGTCPMKLSLSKSMDLSPFVLLPISCSCTNPCLGH